MNNNNKNNSKYQIIIIFAVLMINKYLDVEPELLEKKLCDEIRYKENDKLNVFDNNNNNKNENVMTQWGFDKTVQTYYLILNSGHCV